MASACSLSLPMQCAYASKLSCRELDNFYGRIAEKRFYNSAKIAVLKNCYLSEMVECLLQRFVRIFVRVLLFACKLMLLNVNPCRAVRILLFL